MSISGLKALQISKMVDHILHVPGNYRGGNLEMTVVVSSRLEIISLKENLKAVTDALKRSNEVFRNVRLNFVCVREDGSFENKVIPLVFLQTGKCFETEDKIIAQKEDVQQMFSAPLSEVFAYLKLFHARSKVVLIFADRDYNLGDKEKAKEALNPFLKQKLLLITEDDVITGTNVMMECLR